MEELNGNRGKVGGNRSTRIRERGKKAARNRREREKKRIVLPKADWTRTLTLTHSPTLALALSLLPFPSFLPVESGRGQEGATNQLSHGATKHQALEDGSEPLSRAPFRGASRDTKPPRALDYEATSLRRGAQINR